MAERLYLDWFRQRLAASRAIEPKDPAPVLAWRRQQCDRIRFKADLIGLDEVRGWSRDEMGNVRHNSGQFFGVEGVRIESGDMREVARMYLGYEIAKKKGRVDALAEIVERQQVVARQEGRGSLLDRLKSW